MANNFSSDPNCVALYKFESGDFTGDSIGSNDLTNHGADEETSHYKEGSQSAAFVEANSDYMSITDANQDAGFPFRNADGGSVVEDFTFCFWLYLNSSETSLGNGYIGLISKWQDASPLVFSLGIAGDEKLRLVAGYNSGANYEFDDAFAFGTAFSTGVWYHVGVTYRQSDKSLRLRVWDDNAGDFLDSDTTANITNDIDACDIPFVIGAQSDGAYPLDGYMDEVVVFNRIITPTEIDSIRAGTFSSSTTYQVELTDGVDFSDSPVTKITYYVELSEGVDLGDTTGGGFTSQVGLSDGVVLSDSPARIKKVIGTLVEQVTMSDLTEVLMTYQGSLSEQVVVSDDPLVKQKSFPEVSDGITMSDSPTMQITIQCSVDDGFVLSDSIKTIRQILVEDGIKFGDFSIYMQEKSELDINFIAKELVLEFSISNPIITSFDINPDESSISVTNSLNSFGIKPINFTFKITE